MKRLAFKCVRILAPAAMGLMLVGCQQTVPPSGSPPSTTVEHSTTTNTETKEVTTPPPTVNPDGSTTGVQTQTTQKSTTVEKKP